MSEPGTGNHHLVAVLSHPEEVRTTFGWALSLARQWDLPLTLLHVIDPVTSDEMSENAHAMAQDMLALLAATAAASNVPVTTRVETGMPESVIPQVSVGQPGAVYLLGAGGRGAFSRALLRRGRENVIHHLTSPFVFLPPGTNPPGAIERAVAGVDGSAAASRALAIGRELLGTRPITSVEVVEPGAVPVEEYLELEPVFTDRGVRMRGRAGIALLAVAQMQNAGLIVVGGHGTTGLFGRHLGGTANWLSQHADRPVLIVRTEG